MTFYQKTYIFIYVKKVEKYIGDYVRKMLGGKLMGEVIVITSGKGGVGKTTTTANLGSALALAGKKVALVDTDIGLRNLDVVM